MKTVTLEDGYNGSTEEFLTNPVESDGDLVLLRVSSQPWLTKWARKIDLDKAIQQQSA